MLKKKVLISIILMAILLITNISNVCFAAWVPVTMESLKEIYEEIQEVEKQDSEYEESTSKIEFLDNKIIISDEKETIEVKCDLNDNPTFWVEIPVSKSMTIEEYQTQMGKMMGPLGIYMLVLKMQGVKDEALASILTELAFAAPTNSPKEALITIGSDEPTMEENFEEIKAAWGEKAVTKNEDGGCEYIIETKDWTDMSCTIVSTIVVDKTTNFEKINTEYDEWVKSAQESNTTDENSTTIKTISNSNETTKEITNTVTSASTTNKTTGKLPNSGDANKNIVSVLYMVIVISSISILFFTISLKKKN